VLKSTRSVGQGAYSPGLEYDAKLYQERLESHGIAVRYIVPYGADAAAIKELQNCDFVIGFEELGVEALITAMRLLKQEQRLRLVVLVPNLEVMDDAPRLKWAPTLQNLDVIDVVVSKAMPEDERTFSDLIETLWKRKRVADMPGIVTVPHSCPEPDASLSAESKNFFDPALRRTVLHFAGSSPHKNTLENCLAGVEIVKRCACCYCCCSVLNVCRLAGFPKSLTSSS
jgi:hypothetical protein